MRSATDDGCGMVLVIERQRQTVGLRDAVERMLQREQKIKRETITMSHIDVVPK